MFSVDLWGPGALVCLLMSQRGPLRTCKAGRSSHLIDRPRDPGLPQRRGRCARRCVLPPRGPPCRWRHHCPVERRLSSPPSSALGPANLLPIPRPLPAHPRPALGTGAVGHAGSGTWPGMWDRSLQCTHGPTEGEGVKQKPERCG